MFEFETTKYFYLAKPVSKGASSDPYRWLCQSITRAGKQRIKYPPDPIIMTFISVSIFKSFDE
jgi:hypothetical protein